MTEEERNQLIMEKLNEGMSLSDLQTLLTKEYKQHMTYFELRLLAAELKVNWEKRDRPRQKTTPRQPVADDSAPPAWEEPADGAEGNGPAEPEQEPLPQEEEEQSPDAQDGKAVVTFHETPLPGTALSGDVTFPSGIQSKWFMDRMGQLGLEESPDGNQAQPSNEDLEAFQRELQLAMKQRAEQTMKMALDGRTKVEISSIMKPGCQLNGTVQFASGAKGEWMISQQEGLLFDLDEGSPQPTAEDRKFFQIVLQNELRKKGMA